MREHDPLLPEYRNQVTRPRADARSSKSRNETSSGTLLGMQNLPKAARGQISLPAGPAGGAKCPTADSDLSTTDATGRSQDGDSDCYIDNLSPCRSPGPPEANVIIFDWDDTLLPTSFLRDALKIYPNRSGGQSQRIPGRKSKVSRTSGFPCQAAIDSHCDLIRELLLAARSVAPVAIVTLAERPWVHDSAEHFLPGLNLKRLLRDLDIPVYYAVEYRKSTRNPLCPETPPACSKRMAMDDFINNLERDYGTRLNILSVGDSMAEREAARKAAASLEKKACRAGEPMPWCKTIKFQTDPSLKMLSLELRSLLCNLDRFLALDHDLDLIFEQQDSIEDIEEKILETVGFVGYS